MLSLTPYGIAIPAKENCYVDVEVEVSQHNAELTISDNGIGIEEENIGKLFEMFYLAYQKSRWASGPGFI